MGGSGRGGEWNKLKRAFLHFHGRPALGGGHVSFPFKRSAAESAAQAAEARAITSKLVRLTTRGEPLRAGTNRQAVKHGSCSNKTATVLDELAEWNEELVELIQDGQDWWDAAPPGGCSKNPIAELPGEARTEP